ncbi:Chloroperoxidase [Mycena filopes]|nr:Chloroperoxidase [Mycena filopes]
MTSLPATHPAIDERSPLKACPVTGQYQAPAPGDARSVCPAINAMANHGYIRRDGRSISPYAIYRGLQACYGLSAPLALLLTTGGWFLIKRLFYPWRWRISLYDLGLHNGVEHDASIVHADCPPGQADAPIAIEPALVDEFAAAVLRSAAEETGTGVGVNGEGEVVVTQADVIRTRIRRERVCPPLDALHAEIARGEMAIILGVWGKKMGGREGAPLSWVRTWLGVERLPEGWRPDHTERLRDVVKRAGAMRKEMKRVKEEERGQ